MNECEAEIGTGAITSYDDVGSGYRFMKRIWWWIEERKVCSENIEQSCRKGMLRGKAVANRDTSTMSQLSQPTNRRSKARRISAAGDVSDKVTKEEAGGILKPSSMYVK